MELVLGRDAHFGAPAHLALTAQVFNALQVSCVKMLASTKVLHGDAEHTIAPRLFEQMYEPC